MPFIDFTNAPWKPEAKCPEDIPIELRAMILDHGSLTARLKKQHNNEFFVQLVQQGWDEPTDSEKAFLNTEDTRANIREVILHGSGQPQVFARSVLPQGSLTGKNKALLELGSQPLGEYIFNQPQLTRGPIEIAKLPASQFNPYLCFDYDQEVAWGRRSLFYLNHKAISVCEVFLPARFSRHKGIA